jgi:hypothetical protein
LFKNTGKSEVFVFQFGDALGVPQNVRVPGSNATVITLEWDVPALGDMPEYYRIQYRPTISDQWYDVRSRPGERWHNVSDLAPDTKYVFRVRSEKSKQVSEYSPPITMSTAKASDKFQCGAGESVVANPEKGPPLPLLLPGDRITKQKFTVIVSESKGSNGQFQGRGLMRIPYFNGASTRVTFQGYVDEAMHLIGGDISTIISDNPGMKQVIDAMQKIGQDRRRAQDSIARATLPQPTPVPVIIPGVIDSVFVNDQGDIIVTKQDGSQETVQRPPATSGNGGSGGESIPVVLTDSEGNRYTVNKDGTVTNNGTVSATTVDATVRYGVFFERDNTQAFGFDAKTNEALQRHYPTETVGTSPYIIPWKAVATGSFDQVKAIAAEKRADFAKEIGLVSSFGPLAKRMGSRAGEAIVTVQGRTHEEVEEIRAYLTKRDAEGKEVEETVGRLNVVSYNQVYRTLVLVPVNGTSPGMEAASLQQQLNAIYSQAAVQWTVRIEEGFASTYDQDNNGLEYGNSGLLSNYTGEMRTILRDYTRSHALASDTYYLFITPRADDNSVTGYMPRKKQQPRQNHCP